jgi:hypothetical protein
MKNKNCLIQTPLARQALLIGTCVVALPVAAILLPAPALAAAGTGITANTASAPLLVLTRGNVRMAPAVLSSMSKKAGTPLLLTKSIGTGAYLVRPARPTTAQGLHTIAGRLATHPNILGAQIYKQSAPAYMLAPAGHRVTLDGARLAGSTSPIVSYRWHQILGPNTGVANATRPNVSFLARQAAAPGSSTSDPTAINPGDLTAPPQQLQCAISAASAHRVRINSPVLISKNAFMCDTGNGTSPSTGATPPDSGTPGAGTPPADTGTPGAGTPPTDTGMPYPGVPPTDTVAPPADFGNPGPFPGMPPSSGGPGGPGGGVGSCNGNCDGAVILPGGYCNGNCDGAYLGAGGRCTGNCDGTNMAGAGNSGGPSGMGGMGGLFGMSAHKGHQSANTHRAISPSSIIGYRLIATDKAGVAHVRNIYVRVQPAAASTARPAKATARPAPFTAQVKALKAALRRPAL